MYKAKTILGSFDLIGEYLEKDGKHYIIKKDGPMTFSYLIDVKTLEKLED